MRNRILAGFLAALLLFGDLSLGAFAKEGHAGDGSVSGNTVEAVMENETGTGEDTEAETETETGTDTEAETETETGTVIETETESETESDIEAGLLRSATQSFLVDQTAPFEGNYLLIANTSTNINGGAEKSGAFPVNGSSDITSYRSKSTDIYGIPTEGLSGYDEWGRGLIDPATVLPELEVDTNSAAGEAVASYAVNGETEAISYAVGDTRTFYLDRSSGDTYTPVNCICVATSTHATVWVPTDDPIYIKDSSLMKNYMSTLASEFDTQYSKMTNMFGDVTDLDNMYGDRDGKTALVCYDIDGDGTGYSNSYVAGYFFAADTSFPFSNATGSNCDMLHIDSWQGMNRDTADQILRDVTASKGTIVHEFQHMINFAVNRKNDPALYSVNTPTYLNEAFSMAAEHLCYGAEEGGDRVWYYNNYNYAASGAVSLFQWGAYDTLSNYSLSYLFGQYIRTQYKDGNEIYKDAMNEFDSSSEDLLEIIADLLGMTSKELLLNFRVALFLKNATGPYGFHGEKWADDIASLYVTGESTTLKPGAATVVALGSAPYTPSGQGSNISYMGMYTSLTKEDVSVSISGGNAITTPGGTLQLSASVYPSGVSQSVIFSIPDESDRTYASVTGDGLITAIANGSVTVRATSVYNPEKYNEVTISISGQQRVALKKTENVLDEGYRIQYTVTEPANAKIYYTYSHQSPYENGNLPPADVNALADPTAENDEFPTAGLEFKEAGTYVLKVVGIADGYQSNAATSVYQIEELSTPIILASQNEDGTYTVSMQAKEGATIAYTLDGSTPDRNAANKILYSAPFQVTTPGLVKINAIAYSQGSKTSKVSTKPLEIPVAKPKIVTESILGGKKVTLSCATDNARIYYTLDGSEPTASSVQYTVPLSFKQKGDTVVKAVAVINENQISNAYEGMEFTSHATVANVTVGKTNTVVASQPSGVLDKGEKIYLYCSTADSVIYYTLDGSDPTLSETKEQYSNCFTMNEERLFIRTYACSYGNEDSDVSQMGYVSEGTVKSIAFTEDSKTLYVNVPEKKQDKLGVTIQPAEITAEFLEWSSSDPDVVTVDQSGNVTAVAPGTAVITAKCNQVSDTCTIQVKIAPKTLAITNTDLSISKDGGSLQIQTAVTPVGADANLIYKVETSDREGDKKGIATINENGLLTAVKDGVVKVTVSIPEAENMNAVPPVSVYVTISSQYSFSTKYSPRFSTSSFTLNKQAVEGETFYIYMTGTGGSIQEAVLDENNEYAQYFTLTKETDGSYRIAIKEEGKAALRNKTYRIPLLTKGEIVVGDITMEDSFTNAIKIKVKDEAPSISISPLRINRYASKTEYPLSIRTKEESYTVLSLKGEDGKPMPSMSVEEKDGVISLKLEKPLNTIEAYKDQTSVRGYLEVWVTGFAKQSIPFTIRIESQMPSLLVKEGKVYLHAGVLKQEKTSVISFVEKQGNKRVAITNLTAVELDTDSPAYEKAASVITSVSQTNDKVTLNWKTDDIKAGTYKIPLLLTTDEYVTIPVTAECIVQKESTSPKVALTDNVIKLNRKYPKETASLGIASISQVNVSLTGFVITPYEESLFANKDEAVTLAYKNGKLVASITGTPTGSTYMFTCVPQFANGVTSDQKITVTVKLYEKEASVSVTLNGNIDVLDRAATAVVGSVTKVSFNSKLTDVKMLSPEQTSGSIFDGSDAFTVTYDEDTQKVTIHAKEDYTFIKGKKYAFRLQFTKETGYEGETQADRTLCTKDLFIRLTQSSVHFTVDQVPSLFRYVSEENNTQSLNLRTDNGVIQSVHVNPQYPLKDGISLITGERGSTGSKGDGGNGTLTSICYDGVGCYELAPGYYTCTVMVYMKGAFCTETNGDAVAEPVTCRIRYRIL